MSFTIYHNPRCAKSRNGLKYLQSKTSDFVVNEYLKTGLSIKELKDIILKLNVKPFELIRTNEPIYKKEFKGKKFNDEEWLILIMENPKLLRRPVIVGKHKAVIGDPVGNIEVLFR